MYIQKINTSDIDNHHVDDGNYLQDYEVETQVIDTSRSMILVAVFLEFFFITLGMMNFIRLLF
jgi:hypothetical protein